MIQEMELPCEHSRKIKDSQRRHERQKRQRRNKRRLDMLKDAANLVAALSPAFDPQRCKSPYRLNTVR